MSYWNNPKPVRRARAIALDHLSHEAVALLDEGGVPALTIRSLAGRIGVAPPSLYSRIRSVDDILDLAVDHALGQDRHVWQSTDELCPRSLLLLFYDHLLRHPWSAQVIGLRAPRGPEYLRFSDRFLQLLVERSIKDPLTVAYAMSNFVIGCAVTATSASDDPSSPVDRCIAPTYAQLHVDYAEDPRTIVDAGLRALISMTTKAPSQTSAVSQTRPS
ncbi:TetR/AcrR family transcriptional regulator [Brevibacterium luteolum]|uniref:TetR/AcrR family transcriptional regulator n=1 Tax=Brevibacterium luteolum TaxID=199591 RepID=UPI003B66EF4F